MCHFMKSSCYSGGSQCQYFVGTVLFSYIQDAVIFNGNVENVVTTGYNSKEQSVQCNGERVGKYVYCRGAQIFENSRNHLKILGTRRVA